MVHSRLGVCDYCKKTRSMYHKQLCSECLDKFKPEKIVKNKQRKLGVKMNIRMTVGKCMSCNQVMDVDCNKLCFKCSNQVKLEAFGLLNPPL